MKKRAYIITGIALLFIGAFYLFNFASGITGNVIIENIDMNMSGFAGLWFVVSGLVVLYASRHGE